MTQETATKLTIVGDHTAAASLVGSSASSPTASGTAGDDTDKGQVKTPDKVKTPGRSGKTRKAADTPPAL